MELVLVILSIVIGVIATCLVFVGAFGMIKQKDEKERVKSFGIFLFCFVLVAYAIMVMIYLPLPLG